jgi:hypothetical protein
MLICGLQDSSRLPLKVLARPAKFAAEVVGQSLTDPDRVVMVEVKRQDARAV